MYHCFGANHPEKQGMWHWEDVQLKPRIQLQSSYGKLQSGRSHKHKIQATTSKQFPTPRVVLVASLRQRRVTGLYTTCLFGCHGQPLLDWFPKIPGILLPFPRCRKESRAPKFQGTSADCCVARAERTQIHSAEKSGMHKQ